MKRLTHLFFYTLASIAFLNVFSHSFPSLPALYACMTIFSLLFGVSFLTASGMPSAWTSRKVSSAVWDHWKKILGALFLLNGDGTIVLIGATTENPSFEVIRPLLSRCQLYVLKSLDL